MRETAEERQKRINKEYPPQRPIKFRAWDKWVGKFVDPLSPFTDDVYVGQDGKVRVYSCDEGGCDLHRADENRYEIVWYTGLKDKNSKEIYEGDIVEEGYCQGVTGIVWVDGMYFSKEVDVSWATFLDANVHTYEENMTFLCQSRTDDMEVIGNIYENPELVRE